MSSRCIEETGKELNLNNDDIVKYLCSIEEEKQNLEAIIQKQYIERKKTEAEIEKLTYKLCLINKSLSMRIKAKNNYDKTIEEIRSHYEKLVDSSVKLKNIVEKTQQELDDIMNKKTGTTGPNGEEIKMLYIKPDQPLGPNECPCGIEAEPPTKEVSLFDDTSTSNPSNDNASEGPAYSEENNPPLEKENISIVSKTTQFENSEGGNDKDMSIEPSPSNDNDNDDNKMDSISTVINNTAPGYSSRPEKINTAEQSRNLLLSRLRLSKISEISKARNEGSIAGNKNPDNANRMEKFSITKVLNAESPNASPKPSTSGQN